MQRSSQILSLLVSGPILKPAFIPRGMRLQERHWQDHKGDVIPRYMRQGKSFDRVTRVRAKKPCHTQLHEAAGPLFGRASQVMSQSAVQDGRNIIWAGRSSDVKLGCTKQQGHQLAGQGMARTASQHDFADRSTVIDMSYVALMGDPCLYGGLMAVDSNG